jgi:hypothetical protein
MLTVPPYLLRPPWPLPPAALVVLLNKEDGANINDNDET